MRKCPACSDDLVETGLHGQLVDRCRSCNGIFFDAGELESILRIVDLFTSIPMDEEEIDTVPREEVDRIMTCPAEGIPMDPVDAAGLIIDVCPECRGIWLDGGEITALKIAERHIIENIQLYIRLGN